MCRQFRQKRLTFNDKGKSLPLGQYREDGMQAVQAGGGWGGRVANDGTTTAERRGLTPGVSVGWRGGWRPLQVAGAA